MTKLIALMLLFWQIVMIAFYATDKIVLWVALLPLEFAGFIALAIALYVYNENQQKKKEQAEYFRGIKQKEGWNYWVNENN